MLRRKLLVVLLAALAPAFFLSGCDQAEQGRILRYEKGTYLGKKDQTLSEEQQEDLRQRTRMQQGG